MSWVVIKYLVTAGVVVLVSEAAARSDRLGGLVAALPLVTLMTLVWLHLERQPLERIANHAWYTLWYVLPTLPMFAAFPFLLPRLGFWPTLGASVLITLASFKLFAILLQRFGIHLL
jgi:F0F1-type ATP synthase assembly protein I